MKNKIEMLGKRFNRFIVIGESKEKKDNRICWECR